ncbi:TRAP transporter small permease [Falsirhodobacter halotolerans]|uniref:TRAP transporter small permease n=1 Tax=Falsirhodobacter halotolerans TaxID=1146892 RepID=UPI001FD0609B|nr:TRAP transporter small permease subunit [Falsirhodobacter halotolerans]MCJ8141035.1 TRAP transporter small permease subunit [Falsirhodobacter halotolerans]
MSDVVTSPTAPKGTLRRSATTVVEVAAIVLLVGLVALVLCNSIGRYLFSRPLPWTEEVVTALLMWLGGLGITVAALRNGLIACSIWTARLRPRGRRVLRITQNLFGIATMAALAWFAWQYMGIFGSDRSPLIGMPKAVPISGIIGCAAGLSLAFVIDLIAPEEL